MAVRGGEHYPTWLEDLQERRRWEMALSRMRRRQRRCGLLTIMLVTYLSVEIAQYAWRPLEETDLGNPYHTHRHLRGRWT